LIAHVEVVVNCVGILRERGDETYERIHDRAPGALAVACAQQGVRRLVHVSALGLSDVARSRFIRSKLNGERAIAASGAVSTIVRPSLLEGAGGYGSRWLQRVARWPIHLVPSDATGRIAVLDVRDLGEAMAMLCETDADAGSEVIELGGETQCTLAEYLAALRVASGAAIAPCLRVPAAVARMASHVFDLLHFSPFSFGHLELLRRDNVPLRNALAGLLNHPPRRCVIPRNEESAVGGRTLGHVQTADPSQGSG
jgi:NADH dehydrogenase